jgi:CO/xanthine dehydrogenase FAD-binding subunit
MILEYHRPQNLDEALALLARPQPETRPLGGGTLVTQPSAAAIAVVDLQALALDSLEVQGNTLKLGATLTLQRLLDAFDDGLLTPAGQGKGDLTGLKEAIELEATLNLRQAATVAGTLMAADGRSPFTTVLLAADADLLVLPGANSLGLGDLLPVRAELMRGKLISQVSFPANISLRFAYVARTPADRPIVCAALARWPSGRTRLALGGFGAAPTLAFDGTEPGGLETAAASAYAEAQDAWATAEYRAAIAAVLAKRCLEA